MKRERLRIPKRIYETPAPFGMVDEGYMRKTIDAAKREISMSGEPE
jgi:hypothetical protein